jgi:hypothetical protein
MVNEPDLLDHIETVQCPTCGAAPGVTCRRLSRGALCGTPKDWPHELREQRALGLDVGLPSLVAYFRDNP